MSGYGTKKPGAERGVQLTFPTVFAEQYAQRRMPLKYAPEAQPMYAVQWAGTDEPSLIHQDWGNDAHKRVADAIYATKISKQRAFSSPHGYYNLPKPVRTQRHLGFQTGALQSGNIHSSLYPGGDQLSGGVLRTKQGQDYAKKLLDMRKEQLNKLEGVVLPPRTMEAPTAEEERSQLTETARFELQTLMDSLSSVFAQQTDFTQQTAEQLLRFVQLLGRFMIEASLPEINTIRDNIEAMKLDLEMYSENAGDLAQLYGSQQRNKERGMYFYRVVDKLLDYVDGMLDPSVFNSSPRDKKAKSQSLMRSLGLSDITRATPSAETALNRALARSQLERRLRGNELLVRGEADRASARRGLFPQNVEASLAEQQSRMTMPRAGVVPRETSELGGADLATQFSVDNRQAFGARASRTGYLGEEGLPPAEVEVEPAGGFTEEMARAVRTMTKEEGINMLRGRATTGDIGLTKQVLQAIKAIYPPSNKKHFTNRDLADIFGTTQTAIKRVLG